MGTRSSPHCDCDLSTGPHRRKKVAAKRLLGCRGFDVSLYSASQMPPVPSASALGMSGESCC
jgi:hypothetical protein